MSKYTTTKDLDISPPIHNTFQRIQRTLRCSKNKARFVMRIYLTTTPVDQRKVKSDSMILPSNLPTVTFAVNLYCTWN